jgi:hypothetical protein
MYVCTNHHETNDVPVFAGAVVGNELGDGLLEVARLQGLPDLLGGAVVVDGGRADDVGHLPERIANVGQPILLLEYVLMTSLLVLTKKTIFM